MADWGQIQVSTAGITPVMQEEDSHGQVLGFQLAAAPDPPDPPTIAPTTTLVSPGAGATIMPDTAIVVDVTDPDSGFARILVVATEAPGVHSGVAYLAHDGIDFRPGFKTNSIRTAITNGFRYSLRRDVGWSAPVSVEVFAFDDTGNEGS
jgi:hypothetical protein